MYQVPGAVPTLCGVKAVPHGGTGLGVVCPVPWELCVCQIKKYEKLDSEEERTARSRHIFDHYIMKELLACSHVSAVLCRC